MVGLEHQSSFDTTELNEPQLPTNSRPDVSEEHLMEDVSTIHPQHNRREMFRMIESIRSSSPANTPGKSGFDTPVHLRRFHASNSAAEIPLTPTLAPTENDEGFIGSSPTPATRDPTPAAKKDIPLLKVPDVTMIDSSDLPSSPPEVSSRSPSPQKRAKLTRNQRRRSAKAKKALLQTSAGEQSASNSPSKADREIMAALETPHPDDQDDPKENNDAPQVDERPPSRRTRSAFGQCVDNSQSAVPPVTVETPGKTTETPASETLRSKSASKKKKRKSASRSANDNTQEIEQAQGTLVPPEHNVDSSSEDMETQIASQLEQDLESAVDLGGQVNHTEDTQTAEQQLPTHASKKRKREEEDSRECSSSKAKERRRSTRLTSTKDEAQIDLEEPEPTLSQDPEKDPVRDFVLPDASLDSSAKQETTTPRRSTRSSQRKDDSIVEEFLPATQISESQEPIKENEPTHPPSKRSRTSPPLEMDQLATPGREKPPTRSKSKSKSARSRKSRSIRSETESQDQYIQPESLPDHGQLSQGQTDSQDMVAESIVADNPGVPDLPLVSTEVATDSQVTDTPTSNELAITSTDMQSMDVDEVPKEATATLTQPTTSVFTAEVQTKPTPIPNTGNSETGIGPALQKILDQMKTATLTPDDLRQVDDFLFHIRVAAHDASRRA